MSTHHTSCVLCAQNCGLVVEVENNRIVKVRGDKENVRSAGYICRKGVNIAYHQHNADRLTHPLKREGDRFIRVSWEQALAEIAAKFKDILAQHGPRAIAYMGGGGQGSHFEAAFGVRWLRGLGSQYHYNALGQEFSGMFWVHGRMFGRQYLYADTEAEETDLLLVIGWNGMQSHQIPQAPRHLKRIAEDPDKLLIVIDPRKSETAQIANIHLPIRPGTDALLLRAMIAIILQEGWENQAYIAEHSSGWDEIKPFFAGFDARAAIGTCGLDYDRVREVCRLFASRKSSLRSDLGILMNRHSTVSSYLEVVLMAICGRIGARGGNVFPGYLMPLGSHSDERRPKTWRTLATDMPPVIGVFPPNVMPEEILSGHPERLRAVLVSNSNPLRSYADTTAYEKAFGQLELLVTIEMALTETAALSHYVLPACSAYESWDASFFAFTFPGIYFMMRRPIIAPEGEPLEASEILIRLAERMGLLPAIPESLYQAAEGDRTAFGMALMEYMATEPAAMKNIPFILGKTLGKTLGSPNLAALWGLLQTAPEEFRQNAARAGFSTDMNMGEEMFQKILAHQEGLWIGREDPEHNLRHLQTDDDKINLSIPELYERLQNLTAEKEEAALTLTPAFPLILCAGRHFSMNANTLMRDPAWNEGKRACTVLMHPEDAAALHLTDGQLVKVTTDAGAAEIELEVTENARPGQVVIPHGFGLVYNGKPFGVNVNRLTKNTHRDPLGTPLHRYIPCRVERI